MDIDDILTRAGDYGPYQLMLLSLFAFINVLSAYHYFGQTFISLSPEHKCRLPEVAGNVSMYEAPDAICSRYDTNMTGLEPPTAEQHWATRPCNTGWQYNLTSGYQTIVSEMDWVCGDAWKVVTGQSLFFLGSVLGTLVLGVLSDRIGRLPVLVIANGLAMLGNLTTAFVSTLWQFGGARFIAGIATDSNFFMMYIIVMEYLSPKSRTTGLNFTMGLFYSLGCMAVPWTALLLGSWRKLMVAVGAIHAAVFLFPLAVPESPRWLLQQGRVDEAMKGFTTLARCNNRELDPEYVQRFKSSIMKMPEKKGTATLLGLFRTPQLRRKTCILIFKSMVLTLCYDAISRNVDGLGFSPYVMFTISSATILPSCLVILLLQDRVGRKAMASGSLLVTGLFTIMAGIVLAGLNAEPWVAAILSVVGRLGVTVAYNSGVQYAAELIPTEVRGQGVAAMHVAGYAASFFSPYILFMVEIWAAFPDIILGTLSLVGAFLCLMLPETLHRELPVTLEDGEKFGEGEGYLEFAWRRNKSSMNSCTQLVSD